MKSWLAAWCVAGLVLPSMTVSCGDSVSVYGVSPDAATVHPRESAGVTVVEVPASAFPRTATERPAPDLRVTDVTGDDFVGVRSDELGVEWIEVYRTPAR